MRAGAVAPALRAAMKDRKANRPDIVFRQSRVVQERQQTAIGTLLIFITILFLINFIIDIVRIKQAYNFLATKRE